MGAFFEDLPELLRANTNGEVDVDDFFYLAMVQWAKLTAITIEKVHTCIHTHTLTEPITNTLT